MTFPLWLQIAVGIITAELIILLMKGIKNEISQRETEYYNSVPLDRMQEQLDQNKKGLIKIYTYGAMGVIVCLIIYEMCNFV